MASIDLTMSNHPKLENRTLELQILENLQHLVVQWFFQWIETRFSFALHMFFGLLPVWARYFQSRSCLSHPRRSWPEKFSADLQTLTESGWWCCNVLILKNDGVRQWEGWHPIYIYYGKYTNASGIPTWHNQCNYNHCLEACLVGRAFKSSPTPCLRKHPKSRLQHSAASGFHDVGQKSGTIKVPQHLAIFHL